MGYNRTERVLWNSSLKQAIKTCNGISSQRPPAGVIYIREAKSPAICQLFGEWWDFAILIAFQRCPYEPDKGSSLRQGFWMWPLTPAQGQPLNPELLLSATLMSTWLLAFSVMTFPFEIFKAFYAVSASIQQPVHKPAVWLPRYSQSGTWLYFYHWVCRKPSKWSQIRNVLIQASV